jgi:anti-anti-sigma factor
MDYEFREQRRPRTLPRGGEVEVEVDVPFDLLQVAVSEPRPGVVVVAPVGEVDVATSGMLREAVSHALGARPHFIVVDLAGVTFCGSTGLVVLLDTRHAAEDAGIGFGTFGGRHIVRRVLEITGLGPVLGHRDDLDQVLAAQDSA